MKQFAAQLKMKMESSLQDVAISFGSDGDKHHSAYKVVKDTLAELRAFSKSYSFKDQKDEIHFFKEIKPQFHKELLYYIEINKIEQYKPRACSRSTLLEYYQDIAQRLKEKLQAQSSLYNYYKNNRSTEDHLLFVRDVHHPLLVITDDTTDIDSTFTTVASSSLSKLLAIEKVLDYLEDRVMELDRNVLNDHTPLQQLTWTSSKADLIELAYALHSRGCINGGRAEIQEIITVLETIFKAKLGNFYRTFQSMRLRKKNRTAFLDVLRDSLEKKMDDADRLM